MTLDVAPGAVTWLTGALGSGTSTLLLAMAGLAPRLTGGERRGEVLLDGRDVATLARSARHRVSPDRPAWQLSGIAATVRDEIAVGPMNLGWPVEQIRAAADDAMQRLGIGHLADRAPRALSGGEQQRVLLAALAATSPTLWLLDEPFSALDATSRAHVQQWLRGLTRGGATVVIACDEADTMADIADRWVVLQHGAVAISGTRRRYSRAIDPRHRCGDDRGSRPGSRGADTGPAPPPRRVVAGAVGLRGTDKGRRDGRGAARQPSTPLLECRDVQFAYRDGPAVLRGVSVSVHAGEANPWVRRERRQRSALYVAMALDRDLRHRGGCAAWTRGRHRKSWPRRGIPLSTRNDNSSRRRIWAECGRTPAHEVERCTRSAAVAAVLCRARARLPAVIPTNTPTMTCTRATTPPVALLYTVMATDPELLLLDRPCAALDGVPQRVAGVVRKRVARRRCGGNHARRLLPPTGRSTAPSGCAMGESTFATGRARSITHRR
ncbi:MAG: ATP-binding cassette domain-containing protein [Gemmatimonadetes bacterium]|nr:ATP-binding cassette domain-containing protein [Gemmatimonadota bacterium]